MPGSWTSPSGSRWEPAPDVATTTPQPTAPGPATTVVTGREDAGRRRRGPVLVALVALLSLGGLGAGAYAYERSAGDGTPAAASQGGPGEQPGAAGPGHREGFGGGHHRDGRVDLDAPDAPGAPGTAGDR